MCSPTRESTQKVEDSIAEPQSQNLESGDSTTTTDYLEGARLHILTAGLLLSIFLVNFEISIVSTSLVSITDDLAAFGRSSWVITAYLLAYTAFMVVLTKMSDIFGRKTVLLTCLIMFIIFSGACGAAQNMNELIVFRAFQGFGASGVYSLVLVVLFEMVPPEAYPKYSVFVTALFATSLFSGPLLGGLINETTTWRWVFLLNVPTGVFAALCLLLFIPRNFPNHGREDKTRRPSVRTIDFCGAILMLAALTLLITGFEEASNMSPWDSAQVLVPIFTSVLTWVAFILYERRVTLTVDSNPEPVFPWRFCTNRVVLGTLLNSFFCGAVFTSCIIQVPLRFQTTNNESPWKAGVRLIPFGLATPTGAGLVALVCAKRRFPVVYMFYLASILQILGLAFMSRLTLEKIAWKGQYGLQFVTGLGCGVSIGASTLITPFVIEKRDLATSTGAVVQTRMLGGALALAIVTAIMNSDLKRDLFTMLSTGDVIQVLGNSESIPGLAEQTRAAARHAFLEGYNLQLRVLIGFAGAEIPATLLMWDRKPVRIA